MRSWASPRIILGLSPLLCKRRRIPCVKQMGRLKWVTALRLAAVPGTQHCAVPGGDWLVCGPWFWGRDSLGNNLNRISCQSGRGGTWILAEVNWKKREIGPFFLVWTCEPRVSSAVSYTRDSCILKPFGADGLWALVLWELLTVPLCFLCLSPILIFQATLWPMEDVYV